MPMPSLMTYAMDASRGTEYQGTVQPMKSR